MSNPENQITEIAEKIRRRIAGEVRTDLTARILYSTDASIYQIEPLGVVFPKNSADLQAVVEVCAEYQAPLVARGSGSGLAGQAIGRAWIVDCSRYLDRIIEIDPEMQTAVVEPGLLLSALNKSANQYGLQFGPDPASAERATLGGSLANNASGAHSIVYGMSSDHVISLQIVMADGSLVEFGPISSAEAAQKAQAGSGLETSLYASALEIRKRDREVILEKWPRTWRRASGYNLNYLLPWSPSSPPHWKKFSEENFSEPANYPPIANDTLNLAPIFAGSEGTLGIIQRATIRLVKRPDATGLLLLAFPNSVEACREVPRVLAYDPSAVELIPHNLIRMAQSVPVYGKNLSVLNRVMPEGQDPPSLLVVEFTGDNNEQIGEKMRPLMKGNYTLAISPEEQQRVWNIRKVGLGLFLSRPGDEKPWSFIEDLTVPVEKLGEFVEELYRLMDSYGVEGENYGHASAGCLHIRPIINLKTAEGVDVLRCLASDAVDLTLSFGGAASGEHGDGLARSEWNERMFGPKIISLFREVKHAADPGWIMNPGKIVSQSEHDSLPTMSENLRFGTKYRAVGWRTIFDFSSQKSMEGAIEQCNGAGVCRKSDGVMCPSFQATREEMHSTRGRANLLRAMISGGFTNTNQAEASVMAALDLCLACKGCKAECPSAVDMAKLKYEFLEKYYSERPRKMRDYLFGYIGSIAHCTYRFWFIMNPLLSSKLFQVSSKYLLELSPERAFPKFASKSMKSQWKQYLARNEQDTPTEWASSEDVIFLSDPFTEYFYPEVGLAALKILRMIGCRIRILRTLGTGRTLISKGMLKAAKEVAHRQLKAIKDLGLDDGVSVIGVEPSEVLALCDEYLDFFPGDEYVKSLANRSLTIEEYLVRPGKDGKAQKMRIANIADNRITDCLNPKILLHGHCYQKARPALDDGCSVGVEASKLLLESVGFTVDVLETGCCGMAGAFGYEAEHYHISMQIGELELLKTVRAASAETIISASGVSCRSQIEDGTGRAAKHPIEIVFDILNRDHR